MLSLNQKVLHDAVLLIIFATLSFFAATGVQGHKEDARTSSNSEYPQSEVNKPTSTVYGRATWDDTEKPVRRVQVVLRSLTSFGPEELAATTNARGEFRIKGVPAGRYFIGVNGRGAVSTDSFINLDESRATRFELPEMREYFEVVEVDGKTDRQLVIRARRGGVISGKISYADGDPAADHPVTVLRRKGNRYSMFWTNVNSMRVELLTDDRGVFRVTGLPSGEYIVGATPVIEHGDLIKDSSLEANMIGSSLAMTFHPSTTLVTQATPIRVETGVERAGIDIMIAQQEMHTLAGTVRGRDDRRPVAGARVNITRKETYEKVGNAFWPYSMGMPGVQTDEHGRWRLTQVPDGRYIIFVKPHDANNEPPSVSTKYGDKRQEVEIAGADVNDMLIELGEGACVSGAVVIESGPAPDGIFVALEKPGRSGGIAASTTLHRGRFTIPNVPPGKMYFFINVGGDIHRLYVKSITCKGKDLMRELLDVGEQTKIEGVEIVLSPQVASFNFRVRTILGQSVANASLTLVPADPARWVRIEAQLFCMTDINGRCTIIGAPGEYLVFLLPLGVQSSTLQEDEIEERAAGAQRVSLRPGARGIFDVVTLSKK